MRVIFYHDKRSLNDATRYYIWIIEKAFVRHGIKLVYTTRISKIQNGDIILTITSKYFFISKLFFPRNKNIFWSQGVAPEEYFMSGKNWFKYKYKEIIERFAVRHCNLLFLVSHSMRNHFRYKYAFEGDNYLIMPCYNIPFDANLASEWKINRYRLNSFVYAGSLSPWQCIHETLRIFKEVQNVHTDASLTLLVNDSDKATELVKNLGLFNVEIKYVEMDKLQKELCNYKYGFLIRERNTVNSVATPTKMNSYLASGVIPIYTSALESFVSNIDLGEDNLCLNPDQSDLEKANVILRHMHCREVDISALSNRIAGIFEAYYSDDKYLNEISRGIEKLF